MIKTAKTAAANLAVALLFLVFAYAHYQNYLSSGKLTSLIVIFPELLIVVMALSRSRPAKTSLSVYDVSISFLGTLLPLLLRPSAAGEPAAGKILLCAGIALQLYAVLSLNRSFGIIPAQRGLKTGGAYLLVRHPLYTAYLLINSGYLLNNFSRRNLAVVLATTWLHILRLRAEERLLAGPEYGEYSKKTRWKMLPWVY